MADPIVERVTLAGPSVFGGGRVIASPFQFFFDGATNLRVEGWNSKANTSLLVQGLFLNQDGKQEWFSHTVLLTDNRLRTERSFPMGRGFLQTLAVTAVGSGVRIGQTFARVTVILGFSGATLILGTMLQGYVTAQQGLGWPGSPVVSSQESGGYHRAITGTTPAAGAQISETVPTGAEWEFLSLQGNLETSADVADRRPMLILDTGASTYCISPSPLTTPASSLQSINWAAGMVNAASFGTIRATAGVPIDMRMIAGHRLRTFVDGMQVLDQWQSPTYVVKEWLEAS